MDKEALFVKLYNIDINQDDNDFYKNLISQESSCDFNMDDYINFLFLKLYTDYSYGNYIDYFELFKDRKHCSFEEFKKIICESEYFSLYVSICLEDSFIYAYKTKEKSMGKIYIHVDNKDLYKFSKDLLEHLINENVPDYVFKVDQYFCYNNKERLDNLVLYFNNNNFSDYIRIINKIALKYNLKKPNPFGYQFNNYISIASDYDENGKLYTIDGRQTSFTSMFTHDTLNFLKRYPKKDLKDYLIAMDNYYYAKTSGNRKNLMELIEKEKVRVKTK